jgi:hypothetical protein
MTATAGAKSAAGTRSPSSSPGAAFTRVVSTAVEYGVAKVSRTADVLTQHATASADEAGAPQRAGLRGAQAALRGENPVWAAIKGAWSGSTAAVKAAIVTAMVAMLLLLVLSPVLLLAFLLSLLVVAAVAQVRRART